MELSKIVNCCSPKSVTLMSNIELNDNGYRIYYKILKFQTTEYDLNRPINSVVLLISEIENDLKMKLTKNSKVEWCTKLEEWINKRFV